MVRSSVLASLLLCLVPSIAMSAPLIKEVEINGARLPYVEEGSGEPIVFVHGAFSDLRVWEPQREEVAKRYRFIVYTQRYHGFGAWNDDGKNYNTATQVDDLAKFITSLNAGPVHLVGRSGGARVSLITALKNPTLVRTLTLHEPALLSVLPAGGAEEKAAREDAARYAAAAVVANKAGRSEEHTSELQSLRHLVCRLLLEKKKRKHEYYTATNERTENTKHNHGHEQIHNNTEHKKKGHE